MTRRGLSKGVALTLGVVVGAAFLPGPSSLAADPAAGTVGPARSTVSWTGPVRQPQSLQRTDDFILEVEVPVEYWQGNSGGATVAITWPEESDDFNLHVFERNNDGTQGSFVGASERPPPGRSESIFIADASGDYIVRAIYNAVVDSGYSGTASFSSEPIPGGPTVVFETEESMQFAPASIVSAHFLGSEPMMTMERRIPTSLPGRIDPNRIFVDWPLSTRTQVGQLNRSTDGGDSFRLLFDPLCAQRSRPNCNTGGGGDTVTDVNLVDGTLYFSDQQVFSGNEALASSSDHGDSFPADRQHVVSNAATVTDRQWLAAAGDAVRLEPPGIDVGAFFSYHVPFEGQYVQAIGRADGRPVPQPVPQIPDVVQSGPLRVDSTNGPGRGWIYQPYVTGTFLVATAPGSDFYNPSAWTSVQVWDQFPIPFPWLELDARGNAYAVWVSEGGVVFYSASAIDLPANNPKLGGRPGTTWTKPARVSLPAVGSAAFPEVVAGDAGRVAITYVGAEDHSGRPDGALSTTEWHTYAAVITNALQSEGQPARVTTGRVSHRPVHMDHICTFGTTCLQSDRSLLDMIDIGFDEDGRVAVVFTDNNSGFGMQSDNATNPAQKTRPFALFAKQVSGPSLLAGRDIAAGPPTGNEVADRSGDATWPNQAGGALLPSLDARSLEVSRSRDEIIAQLELADAGFMARDLAAYNDAQSKDGTDYPDAERLQYIVRIVTDKDIYHLSAQSLGDGGPPTFFGGLLGPNDTMRNPDGTILGAAYKADPGFTVAGSLQGNTIQLRAPMSALNLGTGSRVYSVTAFTTAGPRAEDESLTDPMRTVDATPPFDMVVPEAVQPTPTPSVSPSPSVTTSPSPTISPSPAPEPREPADCDVFGTPGNDYLEGTAGGETICGFGGNDVLIGAGGKDILRGGRGTDRLFGGTAADRLNAGPGDDSLSGGPGADTLRGRRGGDALRGGPGRDVLFGGEGRDRLDGGPGRDRCRVGNRERTTRCEGRARP